MPETLTDARNAYEVERRDRHAERPGFRISEIQISVTQKVPWHYHTEVEDTFYVVEGEICIHLREPKDSVTLPPGKTFTVAAKRPHLIRNAGSDSATFLVLQGIGAYDYNPLG
jgi:quercetin dioxygenase-like cupin family protein